jgi:integration host factor subunit alpha
MVRKRRRSLKSKAEGRNRLREYPGEENREEFDERTRRFSRVDFKGGVFDMTKAGLVEIVCDNLGVPLKESAEIIEQVFGILKETLESGEKVKISGFGNFVVRQKRPRRGRNPQTGGEIVISGRKVVTFKTSNVLRKALNKGEQ